MIAKSLVFLTILYCATLDAAIYRWVDAEGRVHFSDRREQGSEQLESQKDSTRAEAPKEPRAPVSDDAPFLGPYSDFEIVSPAANETLNQDKSDLSISLILDPPLMAGHRLDVVLDGIAVAVNGAATQFKLSGAAFGSHRLQARITDADGLVIARTSLQGFHLRKPQQPGLLP